MFTVPVCLPSVNVLSAAAQAENLVEVIVIIVATATSPSPLTPLRKSRTKPTAQHHAGTQSGGTN
jgi:hypothetical protein